MKKFTNILIAAAVMALAVVSCVKEQENKPGAPDAEDCYGVYFPQQEVIEETQIFDPTQDKEVEIKVARTVSDGALTVKPVVSVSSITANGLVEEDAELFTVPDIVFEDGQEETTILVEFPEVKEGVQYALHLKLEGDAYVSKYSSKLTTCDYKMMCVAYQDFLNPVTKERAKITFTLGWWEEKRTAYIKYYEVDGIRYCETYDEALVGTVTNGEHVEKGGFWGVDPDQHLHFMWYLQDDEECSDCGKKHSHTIPAGYEPAPEGAEVMTFNGFQEFDFGWAKKPIVVDYYYYQLENGYARPYLHFLDANSLYDNASYYDKNGGFYFWILGYNTLETPGSGWGFPQDYDIIGIAEGFTRADYTLKLDAGITEYNAKAEANVVPVSFKVGPDVDKVGYTIREGILSGAAIDAEEAAIAKDTIDFKYATFVEAEGKSFTDSIALDKSGIYTLVAVGLDTLKNAQSAASITFKYLAADDQDKVIVSVSASSTEAYVSKGYNPDNSLAYTVSGVGITAAIPMVYSAIDVIKEGGIEKLVSNMEASPNVFLSMLKDEEFTGALPANALANANDKGYTDIISGLTPGTEFYVVIWATNGYSTAVAYDKMKTTGDPLPIYQNFTLDDYYEAGELASRESVIGTWNYYGTDASGSLGMREYLGKLVFTASETETEGPDDDGLYDEYVYADGLFGDISWLAKYDMSTEAVVEMDVYGGIVYHFQKTTVPGNYQVYLGSKGNNDFGYAAAYFSAFVPVADGYYAFLHVSSNYTNMNFCGISLRDPDAGWIAQIWDPLFVDPDKDNNGLAPAKVNKAIAAAKARLGRSVETVSATQFVGQKQAIHAVIDAYQMSYKTERHTITPAAVEGLAPVTRVQRVAAKHSVSSSKVVNSAKDHFTLAQFDMRKKMN